MQLSRSKTLLTVALAAISALSTTPIAASELILAMATDPIIVRDDRGGNIVPRAHEIDALRHSGQDVKIVGSVCYSSCTMYLGLPTACVSENTVFGFHGPSRSGTHLDPALFERASQFIGAHYPRALRDWYLNTARHRTNGVYLLAASDVVAMGVMAC